MSCKLKHKDSKSNTKEVMMSNGAIDNFYKITNLGIFRSFNTKLSDLATSKYGITGRLYLEDNNGTKAIPNTTLFDQIDKKRKELGLYDNQERANTISKPTFQFKEGKAKDLVIEIANSGGTYAPLANKLKERIGDVKVKSVQVGSDKYKELAKIAGLNDFQGLYVPSDDIIYMVEGIEYNQEQILLHEVLHHLTAFEIRRPGNKEKIESIYQRVLMELEKNNISTSIYALKNIDEFVVGLFTDPKLVKILTDLPGESTSIWKDIVDFLKSMIGVEKQDTLFDEVIKDVVTVIGDRSTEYFTFEGLEDLSMASVNDLNEEVYTKTFKNSLYRGQEKSPTIDKHGNLLLIPTEDSLFRSKGISFADNLGLAISYGERYSKNPYIIEINEDYADKIFPLDKQGNSQSYGKRVIGDENEQRFISKEVIIIPNGEYKIHKNKINYDFKNIPTLDLVKEWSQQFIETDVAEFYRYGEANDGYATNENDYYIEVEQELSRRGVSSDELLFLKPYNPIEGDDIIKQALGMDYVEDLSQENIDDYTKKQKELRKKYSTSLISSPGLPILTLTQEQVEMTC